MEGFVSTHQPCDDCGSSDGLGINGDGSTHCFSCGAHTFINDAQHVPKQKRDVNARLLTGTYSAIISRRILKETAQKYCAQVSGDVITFGYFGEDPHTPVAWKVRYPDKRFITEGSWKEGGLFGQQLFSKGGKVVTITEGEFDAMAASQLFDNKYPVVSVRNGASSAAKDCKEQYDWLDSFETIVICFDADAPGQAAAKDVAELFGSKAKIVKLTAGKDANEYLMNGKSSEFIKEWWAAEQFMPDGIVSADALLQAVLVPMKRSSLTYPFKRLDDMLYGIREAELVTLCAGSGLGKSTILREIAVHVMQNCDSPIGCMFLEETPERTLRGLIGLEMNKPIHLPDVEYDAQEVLNIYDRRRYGERVYFWDSFGSNEIERVLGRMRYFVVGLGCRFIILDHLSILVSDQAGGDERRTIDMIMTRLRMFAQEMRITLLLVSHLKRPEGKSLEDGAMTSLGMLRGSAAIAQLSDAVIGAERNSQAEDVDERNRTKLRVLKNRFAGKTGPAGVLVYNEHTGRLTEETEDAL